jgi:hypothetical protein
LFRQKVTNPIAIGTCSARQFLGKPANPPGKTAVKIDSNALAMRFVNFPAIATQNQFLGQNSVCHNYIFYLPHSMFFNSKSASILSGYFYESVCVKQ